MTRWVVFDCCGLAFAVGCTCFGGGVSWSNYGFDMLGAGLLTGAGIGIAFAGIALASTFAFNRADWLNEPVHVWPYAPATRATYPTKGIPRDDPIDPEYLV